MRSRRKPGLNDADREGWTLNDEGLYRWWRGTRLPMHRFIRAFRTDLDACINNQLHRKEKE